MRMDSDDPIIGCTDCDPRQLEAPVPRSIYFRTLRSSGPEAVLVEYGVGSTPVKADKNRALR
jgi:hypothetical protein